mgnify:CR=1 FL=1
MNYRLGYACINMELSAQKPKVSTNRTMRKKTFQEKGINYASELILQNVRDLKTILEWNVANNISLLASHLLVDPQKMALRSATDTTEGDLFLIVNGEDTLGYRAASLQHAGQIAAFMLNKGQNIVAPSHLVTDGVFKDIAVDIDDIYTIVKRTIGGATKFYLEIYLYLTLRPLLL